MAATSRQAWTVAGFAAVLHVALVVFAFGFVSLLAEIDPIGDPAAGRLTGPSIVAVSALIVFTVVGRGIRSNAGIGTVAVVGAAITWISGVIAGMVAYAVTSGTVIASLVFALAFMALGFGLLVVLTAGAVIAVGVAVGRFQAGGARRPRWPWERDDEAE